MPKKGDALDELTAVNAIDHLSNATATINAASVAGIFSKDYIEALDVAGFLPLFTCVTSQLELITPQVSRGTSILINAAQFTIQNIQDGGDGMTVLVLEAV